jgi:hypothetical protein
MGLDLGRQVGVRIFNRGPIVGTTDFQWERCEVLLEIALLFCP